jgi:amino acid transporter
VAKKPEPPRFPAAFLVASLALTADVAGLVCLFLSDLPLPLKLGVGVALVAIPFGSLTYFVGKKRQWIEMRGYIHELERELQLRGGLPADGVRAREAA